MQGESAIGLRIGDVLNRYKVRKRFVREISDRDFTDRRGPDSIDREPARNGVYVIRASLEARDLPAGDCVRSYRALTRVKSALRTGSLSTRIPFRVASQVVPGVHLQPSMRGAVGPR